MDDVTAALAATIGARVRVERQARGWTLDDLAASAGVSRRMVVNIEQGEVNPSVGVLLRLSDALGVGLPRLVEPPSPTPIAVTRKGTGATLWTGLSGGAGVLLAATAPPNVVELWEWRLAPHEQHESEAHSPGTRELVEVRQGSLQLLVDGEATQLSAGDAATFDADVPHVYRNTTARPARFTLVVFQPVVGGLGRAGASNA